MGNFTKAQVTELRIYENPNDPVNSDYQVSLPITVLSAVVDPDSGESLVNIIDDFRSTGSKLNILKLASLIWGETSDSPTIRTVEINGITSWDDIINIPIHIQVTGESGYGTLESGTLTINDLEPKNLCFISLDGNEFTTVPSSDLWVRSYDIYEVVWDGVNLMVINPKIRNATTEYAGIIKLIDSIDSTSINLAPTANAVKTVYDKTTEIADIIENFIPITNEQIDALFST